MVIVVAATCYIVWYAYHSVVDALGLSAPPADATPAPASTDLRVAYSPEKEALFRALADSFNAQNLTAQDGTPLRVAGFPIEPSAMIDAALAGEMDAVSPDSSLWLTQLDDAWASYTGSENALLVGQSVRYAVSPVVIIMWRDVAQNMGWPARAISWVDLMSRAQSDPDFAWSHASTSTASGLLATLAEFYAGAGKTRDLTIADVQSQATLDYVAAIERTVRFYGQGEWDVAQQVDAQMRQNGTRYLDAFVGQEQLAVYLNRLGHDVVAVYPSEGALWVDHPLALLETGNLSDVQRLAFQHFATYVTSPEAQQRVLEAGYRPADLDINLQQSGSPFAGTDAVDPTQPTTGLQIPGGAVVAVVQDVWWYTKRPTDVYLVVDTSGSMDGAKLTNVRDALYAFLDGIQGSRDRVGLIEFYDDPHLVTPLAQVTPEYRERLRRAFGGLRAGGETALLDGVRMAYERLQEEGDRDHINAIIAMTDGIENSSVTSLRDLTAMLSREGRVPVVVFAVAYGDDADFPTLQAIVDATNGRVWEGSPETIRNLYRVMSTYF
ncbi:MAG: VWA domain-containing protein [Anaerolineae bacterium]|nr:VWA domain-containing protein [Anaerolineae bacterium]